MVIDLELEPAGTREEGYAPLDAAIAKWQDFPASCLSHHGAACCDIAREWITGMDYSQLSAGHPLTGPRWLRKLFKWGPSQWPMHWCTAVREKTLDCGALAALSRELYLARGVRSFPAQFILEFNDASTRHWRDTWGAAGSCAPWINDGMIYHEGCAVAVEESEIKLWDATATWWINPKQFGGYAGLLAVRVFDQQSETPAMFTWGEHRFPAKTWHRVERAKADFAPTRPAPKPRTKRRPRPAGQVAAPAVIA